MNEKIKVLMISGKKLAGKDTICDWCIRNSKELFPLKTRWTEIKVKGPWVVKKYGMADSLKSAVSDLFDFPYEWTQTQEGKEKSLPHILWRNLPHYQELLYKINLNECLKVRELLQEFGTGICRRMFDLIWVNKTFRKIEEDKPDLALINDVRYINEIYGGKNRPNLDVKVIRLTRNVNDMSLTVNQHTSETALDDYKEFDAVIDNRNLSIEQTNQECVKLLKEWRWVK